MNIHELSHRYIRVISATSDSDVLGHWDIDDGGTQGDRRGFGGGKLGWHRKNFLRVYIIN